MRSEVITRRTGRQVDTCKLCRTRDHCAHECGLCAKCLRKTLSKPAPGRDRAYACDC